MLFRQVFCIIGKSDTKCLSRTSYRFLCINVDDKPVKRQERKLRQWRQIPDEGPKSLLSIFDRSATEAKAKRDTSFGDLKSGEDFDSSVANIRKQIFLLKEDYKKDGQKFEPRRLEILGSDLAIAHFLLFRGGKVKFRGETEWRKSVDELDKLPVSYDPKYVVTAVDCSGMELFYEGLRNFENLTRVKWASFRGNPVLDEWSLDRIVGQIPCLEYLDISNCPKLNERGLEALYKLFRLQTLIVTNYENSAAFELTCMLLEDCNPNLKCEILEPGENPTEVP